MNKSVNKSGSIPATPGCQMVVANSGPKGRLNEKAEFKKDVSLIHLYSQNMNLVPRKLMSSLIFLAREQSGPKFICNVSDVLEQIGYTSRDLHYFHEALKYLMSSRVEWNVLDAGGKNLIGASTFISSYQIVNGHTLEFSFSAHLLERIHNPEIFSIFDMAMIRRFSRVGGLSLYETCKRFSGVGHTAWHSVETWRKVLDAMAPVYDTTARLMDKVIKPALDEVNQISDIDVKLDVTRVKKRITEIRFVVSEKQQQMLAIMPEVDPTHTELYAILTNDFGLRSDVAARFVTVYPEDYIRDNIAVTQIAVQKSTVKNVSGFLVRALEQDWRKKETYADRLKAEAEKKVAKTTEGKKKTEETHRIDRSLRDSSIWAFAGNLQPADRAALFDEFVQKMPHMFRYSKEHRDSFANAGVVANSPMVKAALSEFIENHSCYKKGVK